jgi:glycosyltransferase involved in cell wall biosynthesis
MSAETKNCSDQGVANELATASVVIPCYNSGATIAHTLDHLLDQTAFDRILEVIIVDSSDDDVTKEVIARYINDKIKTITSGVRIMPAIQRNIGAKSARGDVLCFIDADAYPADDWVERVLDAYSNGTRVGGGSYLVPPFQKDNKLAVAQYYLEFNEYIDTGKPRPKKMIPTCNMYCERSLFNSVGGIPEIRASEDTLFGLTVGEIEIMVFFPQMRVYHIFRENLDHYLSNQVLLGKYIYVYRKYHYNSIYLHRSYFSVLFPVFMLVKFLRIFVRIVVAGPVHWKGFAWSAPLFFKGLWYWGKGFAQGCKEYDSLKMSLQLNNMKERYDENQGIGKDQ